MEAVRLNKKNLAVRVTEAFSWEGTVKEIFEQKLEELREEKGHDPLKGKKLTKKAKLEIMELVFDEIRQESWEETPWYTAAVKKAVGNWFDYNVI